MSCDVIVESVIGSGEHGAASEGTSLVIRRCFEPGSILIFTKVKMGPGQEAYRGDIVLQRPVVLLCRIPLEIFQAEAVTPDLCHRGVVVDVVRTEEPSPLIFDPAGVATVGEGAVVEVEG